MSLVISTHIFSPLFSAFIKSEEQTEKVTMFSSYFRAYLDRRQKILKTLIYLRLCLFNFDPSIMFQLYLKTLYNYQSWLLIWGLKGSFGTLLENVLAVFDFLIGFIIATSFLSTNFEIVTLSNLLNPQEGDTSLSDH